MKSVRALRAALPHAPPAPFAVLHRLHPVKCPCPPCGGTSGTPGACPDPCGSSRPCSGDPPPPSLKPVCPPSPPNKPACPPDPCLKNEPKKDPCPPKADPYPPKRSGKKCFIHVSPTPEDCDRSRMGVFCRIENARAARQAAYETEARFRQAAAPPAACCYAPLVSVPLRDVDRCAEPPFANLSPSAHSRCPPPPVRYAAVPPGRPPPPVVCTLRSPRYLARFPDPLPPVRTCAAAGCRDTCARLPPNDVMHESCALPGDDVGGSYRAPAQPCAVTHAGRCESRAGHERRAFQPPRPQQPCAPAVRYPYRPARYP